MVGVAEISIFGAMLSYFQVQSRCLFQGGYLVGSRPLGDMFFITLRSILTLFTKYTNKNDDLVVVSNIFYFHPYLGKIPILTNIFQTGWNHQLDDYSVFHLVFHHFCRWNKLVGHQLPTLKKKIRFPSLELYDLILRSMSHGSWVRSFNQILGGDPNGLKKKQSKTSKDQKHTPFIVPL